MKRNLFKKLAFVMALALVITAVAPAAAPVNAAANPKLKTSSKVIYVGKSFNFIINSKVSKSTYAWTSSDKKVATVSKTKSNNGMVKAVAPGKATISCKITLPTKKTTTLKATVTVRQDATAVKINNPVDTMKVGDASYQFKRGITPKASTNGTFYVIDAESNTAGAVAVNDKGVINVAKPGEFKIKAVTARSRAQFNAGNWKAESEWLTVTVPVEMTSKLTAANKVEIASNGEFDDVTASDIVIREKETQLRQPVKSVDKSGKVVNVTLYSALTNGKTYTVALNGVTSEFTATIGTIASIVMTDQVIATDTDASIVYRVLDENGLDITSQSEFATLSNSGYSVSNSAGSLNVDNNTIRLYNEGDITYIKISYTYYTTEGKAVTISSEQVKYTASKLVPTKITNWFIHNRQSDRHNYDSNHTIKAEDTGYYLFAKYTDSSGSSVETYSDYDGLGNSNFDQKGLKFTSMDTNVLGVDYNTGLLYPVKAGTADVKVTSEHDSSFVDYITVTVQAKREISSLDVSSTSVSLSNVADVSDSKTVDLTLKDQYGDRFGYQKTSYDIKARVISGSAGRVKVNGVTMTASDNSLTYTDVSAGGVGSNNASKLLKFEPGDGTTGTTVIRFEVNGYVRTVSVTIAEPKAASGYIFDITSTELNNYNLYPNAPVTTNLDFTLYEKDSSGIKRSVVSNGAATYNGDATWVATYEVKNSSGDVKLSDTLSDKVNINAIKEQLDVGTYTIVVTVKTMKNGSTTSGSTTSTSFKVSSDKPVSSAVAKKVSVSVNQGTTMSQIIADALDLKLGSDVIDFTKTTGTFSNYWIEYVKFTSYNSTKMISNTSDASGAGLSSIVTGDSGDKFLVSIREIVVKENIIGWVDGQQVVIGVVSHKITPNIDITITVN